MSCFMFIWNTRETAIVDFTKHIIDTCNRSFLYAPDTFGGAVSHLAEPSGGIEQQ